MSSVRKELNRLLYSSRKMQGNVIGTTGSSVLVSTRHGTVVVEKNGSFDVRKGDQVTLDSGSIISRSIRIRKGRRYEV